MDKYVLKVSLQGFKVSLQRKRENTNECLVSLRIDKVMAFFSKAQVGNTSLPLVEYSLTSLHYNLLVITNRTVLSAVTGGKLSRKSSRFPIIDTSWLLWLPIFAFVSDKFTIY